GQETTLLALYNSVYHFGGIIVPPGYTDPAVKFNDGNPYGVSHISFNGAAAPADEEFAALDHLAQRTVAIAGQLKAGASA
ncbi:MAG: NAD(P)H dehydrogenase, partial [Candidatus Nanopelagicales bacterium]